MQKYNYCFKFTVLLKVAFYAKCFLFCKLSISDPKDTKKGHNLRFKICSTLKKFNQPQSTLNAYKSENIYSTYCGRHFCTKKSANAKWDR